MDKNKWLEVKRNIFHLVFGALIAYIIYRLPKTYSLAIIGVALICGLLISLLIKKKYNVPIFSWFIKKFERKEAFPGKGVITFLTGSFIALAIFSQSLVFISVLILAFGDSFSTIIGHLFGKVRIYKKKTIEGFVAFFIAGTVIAVFFTPIYIAMIAALVGAIVELFAVIDDNICIPPLASLAIYLLI